MCALGQPIVMFLPSEALLYASMVNWSLTHWCLRRLYLLYFGIGVTVLSKWFLLEPSSHQTHHSPVTSDETHHFITSTAAPASIKARVHNGPHGHHERRVPTLSLPPTRSPHAILSRFRYDDGTPQKKGGTSLRTRRATPHTDARHTSCARYGFGF